MITNTNSPSNGVGDGIKDVSTGRAGRGYFWSLSGDVNVDRLKEAAAQTGLAQHTLPEQCSHQVALTRATGRLARASTGTWVVSKVKGTPWTQFTSILPEGGEDKLLYQYEARVRLVPEDGTDHDTREANNMDLIEVDPPNWEWADLLRDEVKLARAALTTDDMSAWLSKSIDKLHGIALRPNGGIYFLPVGEKLNTWLLIVETLNLVSEHKFYGLVLDTLESVIDGITAEASAAAEQMELELEGHAADTSAMGKAALSNRIDDIKGVESKVGEYEALLGSALPDIQTRLKTLRAKLIEARITVSDGSRSVKI